jgi:hypothetical protein
MSIAIVNHARRLARSPVTQETEDPGGGPLLPGRSLSSPGRAAGCHAGEVETVLDRALDLEDLYQTEPGRARSSRVTPKQAKASAPASVSSSTEADAGLPAWALPESVQIAMADLAETAKEGLLAVGTGLQVMQVLMEDDVNSLAGPKGKWNPDLTAKRHGTDDGQVTLGARRVPIRCGGRRSHGRPWPGRAPT